MKVEKERTGDSQVFKRDNGHVHIDARRLHYRELNAMVKRAALEGAERIVLENVYGQRYIGSGVRRPVRIDIFGVPGNDLGAFMDGPEIVVHRNAQDGVGNTMNSGSIVVHGRAGDIVAMGMRGGSIYIKGSVGYRAAIHMKEYMKHRPVLIIGGSCQDFLGEYMAGGMVVILGLDRDPSRELEARHLGTGMHGGAIYLRGGIDPHNLGAGVGLSEPGEEELSLLRDLVGRFCGHFGGEPAEITSAGFVKLAPLSRRPYGNLYAY